MRNKNTGYIIQKIEGKISIFDTDRSTLLTLNETGSFIFTKLKSGWNMRKIAAELVKKYEVDDKKALQDVIGFVYGLKKYHIYFKHSIS